MSTTPSEWAGIVVSVLTLVLMIISGIGTLLLTLLKVPIVRRWLGYRQDKEATVTEIYGNVFNLRQSIDQVQNALEEVRQISRSLSMSSGSTSGPPTPSSHSGAQ